MPAGGALMPVRPPPRPHFTSCPQDEGPPLTPSILEEAQEVVESLTRKGVHVDGREEHHQPPLAYDVALLDQ